MDQPSSDLILKATAGDRVSFAMLVEQEYDFIFKTAWKWTRNQADAEDVAQEVCIRLGKAISKFTGHGRFKTWLYTLVLNVVRDTARKSRRDLVKSQAFHAEAGTLRSVHDGNDGEQQLWLAVRQLPDKQKDTVLLVYAEGMTHSQAADVLGIAESTVSWHLHEARKRLKELLKSEVAYG